MAPSSSGDSRDARKIAVGPSAPPMIPMAAASRRVNEIPGTASDRASAPSRVAKIPNCAAAPSSAVRGLASSGPKSVSAPTPMKISSGNSPLATPAW